VNYKDFEINGLGLIEPISRYLPGGTEKTTNTSVTVGGVAAENRTENEFKSCTFEASC
jgi:hypothetical protein